MNIVVPISYTEEFLPSNRCKNVRCREMAKVARLSVLELPKDEFPVAYKVTDHHYVLPKVRCREEAWELCRHGDGGKSQYFYRNRPQVQK